MELRNVAHPTEYKQDVRAFCKMIPIYLVNDWLVALLVQNSKITMELVRFVSLHHDALGVSVNRNAKEKSSNADFDGMLALEQIQH